MLNGTSADREHTLEWSGVEWELIKSCTTFHVVFEAKPDHKQTTEIPKTNQPKETTTYQQPISDHISRNHELTKIDH